MPPSAWRSAMGREVGELGGKQGVDELLEVVVAQALVEVAVSTLGHGLTPLLQPDRAGTAVGNFDCSVPIQPGDTGSIG